MRTGAGTILEWVPDLSALPSRKLCGKLATRAKTQTIKEELTTLSKKPDAYEEQVVKTQLSLAELLVKYEGSWELSIGELCAIAKPLGPRFYSVSSSPAGAADPRLVTVSVGQVQYTTPTGRVH